MSKDNTQLSTNFHKRNEAFELRFHGASIGIIAEKISANPATLSSYFSREWRSAYVEFAHRRVSELQREVSRQLLSLGGKALSVLDDVMDRGSDYQKLSAAKYILDKVNSTDARAITKTNPVEEMLRQFEIIDEYGNLAEDISEELGNG